MIVIDAPPSYHFNDAAVATGNVQKHLCLFLDKKLAFNHHMKEKLAKTMKGINVIRKLSNALPRHSLVTIYKSFVRAHDQPNNDKFCQRIESMHYNAAKQNHIKNLRLESLKFRRLCTLFKIKSSDLLKYLFDYIPQESQSHNIRSITIISKFYCRTDLFKYSFFPFTINEWNNINWKNSNTESLISLRKNWSTIAKSSPTGLKLLTRLKFCLGHFNSNRFSHNFPNCVNLLCSCSLEIESLSHIFLHCHFFTNIRLTLLEELAKIDLIILNLCYNSIVEKPFYGSSKYDMNQNSDFLNATIKYVGEVF